MPLIREFRTDATHLRTIGGLPFTPTWISKEGMIVEVPTRGLRGGPGGTDHEGGVWMKSELS
jgi:hypothetical protein